MNSGGSTLSGVTVSTGSTITTQDGTVTALLGTITNHGTLALASAGDFTDLRVSGNVDLTGGGTVTMSNFTTNRIDQNAASSTLTNVDNTIQGSGQIGVNGLTLVNQATINANQPSALLINAAGTTNTGMLEATAGGTLNLASATTNTSGTILSSGAGSIVNLSGSTITSGTLTTSGGGVMNSGGSTLSGVTVSTGSTITTQDGTVTALLGTITNHGTLALASAGDFTDLRVSGNVDLTGGGTVTMSNFTTNRIDQNAASSTLTNVDNTIQGSGQIGVNGLTLVNQATINANQSSALLINAAGTTNTGTLEATAGGTLNLASATTNTSGTILSSGAGSIVNLSGSTITSGTLTTSAGGVMNSGGSTLSGLTVSTGSTITTQDGTVTALLGTITNHGTLASRLPATLQTSGSAATSA